MSSKDLPEPNFSDIKKVIEENDIFLHTFETDEKPEQEIFENMANLPRGDKR